MHRWRGREPLRQELVGGTAGIRYPGKNQRRKFGGGLCACECVCVCSVCTHYSQTRAESPTRRCETLSCARTDAELERSSSATFSQKLLSDSLAAAPPSQTPLVQRRQRRGSRKEPIFALFLSRVYLFIRLACHSNELQWSRAVASPERLLISAEP